MAKRTSDLFTSTAPRTIKKFFKGLKVKLYEVDCLCYNSQLVVSQG